MKYLRESKEDKLKFKDWVYNELVNNYPNSLGNKEKRAEEIVNAFIGYKPQLKSPYNDFYYWIKEGDIENLQKYLSDLDELKKNRDILKQSQKDGARLVYSDNDWKVYEITTYEASAKYGKGTKWCISGSKRWANGEEGAGYFDQYYSQDGVRFYFFINKDTKYALAVYPDNSCEIFNAEDVGIPYIPNAPVIDEIKAEYKNESDSNILVNAIMNKKIDSDTLQKIIQETFEDNVGYECIIYNRDEVDGLISDVANMIPDGYLEYEACANGDITPEEYQRLTGIEFDDSLDYWDGDIPAFSGYELASLSGDTKEEKLKSLRYTLENEAEYVVLEENYDGWSITPLKDYTELFMWANNRCGINDWSDGELDDFFINSLDSEDLEHLHGGRMYVFPIMLANRLIWDIKNGEVSSSVISNIGLSKDYLSKFKESFDKLHSKLEKVSQNVLNEAKNSDYYYHGSTDKGLKVLNRPINWLTKDYEYAKMFATYSNDIGYIYKCNPTLGNLFDAGDTTARVYDLYPLKPYRLSREFTNIVRRLNLSEDKVNRLLENVIDEYQLDNDGYKMKIDLVTRSVAFKRILEALGFEGIHAVEYNEKTNTKHETVGLFNSVEVIDCDEVKLNESLKDALFKDESITEEKAITWGDLDYAKKTDTRKMMGGRGTGHFGTGFYFVGKEGPYGLDKDNKIKKYDYEPSRPIYEIELDNYNLYKPKDNDSAYRLHDTLKEINDGYEPSLDIWLNSNFDEEVLEDELFNIGWTLVDEDLDDDDIDLDFDDLDDLLNKDEESKDYEDAVKEQDKSLDNYRKLVKEFITKYGLDEYVWKDIDTMKSGEIERHVEDAIHYKARNILGLKYALKTLSKMFNVNEKTLLDIIHKAYESNSEDSISTMLMKGLGYEGIDVTHLNHDAQGLSGLDNFGYGTVIYDLKPGTFKKIMGPREGGSIHAKAEESLTEMQGKGEISDEKIKNYFMDCVDEMYKLNFWDKDFVLHYELINLQYGDTIHTFGTFKWPGDEKGEGTLILNKHMFNEPEKAIKNTIYHELCHYVVFKWGVQRGVYYTSSWNNWRQNTRDFSKSAWSAHGQMWQMVASKVGRAVGQDITRTDSYNTHTGVGDEAQKRYKYVFRCTGCGNEFGYTKRTRFVDTYLDMSTWSGKPLWNCPKCGAGTHSGDKPPFEMIKGK